MRHSHVSSHHFMSGGRYPVLRTVGIFYLLFAALAAIAGCVGAVWTMIWAPATLGERISMGLGVLAGTFFAVLALLVIAEGIKLFLDIERNTRLSAMAHGLRSDSLSGAPAPANTVVAPDSPTLVGDGMHTNRMAAYIDEETAEAALLRGH